MDKLTTIVNFGWRPHSKLWGQLCKQVWSAMGVGEEYA